MKAKKNIHIRGSSSLTIGCFGANDLPLLEAETGRRSLGPSAAPRDGNPAGVPFTALAGPRGTLYAHWPGKTLRPVGGKPPQGTFVATDGKVPPRPDSGNAAPVVEDKARDARLAEFYSPAIALEQGEENLSVIHSATIRL